MSYDAVSAYTVLFGEGDAPATVSVHGSAEEAWRALAELVRPHLRRRVHRQGWTGRRTAAADETAVREAAERWRLADPGRRFWQVSSHRLQVTVPAIGIGRVVQRSSS